MLLTLTLENISCMSAHTLLTLTTALPTLTEGFVLLAKY